MSAIEALKATRAAGVELVLDGNNLALKARSYLVAACVTLSAILASGEIAS